jgi:hypothetical protein
MAFLIGLLVNAILLSIPIGASLGTMIAIRPFRNERVPETVNENTILEISFCDATHTFHEFSQNKNGVNYTSKWGISCWAGQSQGYHQTIQHHNIKPPSLQELYTNYLLQQ